MIHKLFVPCLPTNSKEKEAVPKHGIIIIIIEREFEQLIHDVVSVTEKQKVRGRGMQKGGR